MKTVSSSYAGRIGIRSVTPKAALSRAATEPPDDDDIADDDDNRERKRAPAPPGMGLLVDKIV